MWFRNKETEFNEVYITTISFQGFQDSFISAARSTRRKETHAKLHVKKPK